ncbi:MAG: hypothetical protein HFJ09_13020 [Lachnospiraceae bacterium]|nr:hypothetical protein [Lachnospiraceae bacterium]
MLNGICPVCFWKNDVFDENPEMYSGVNHMTLEQRCVNFNYQVINAYNPTQDNNKCRENKYTYLYNVITAKQRRRVSYERME